MDELTELFRRHYSKTFELHGPTSKGVDWGDPDETRLRYQKMLQVLDHDFQRPQSIPSLLDVGCGWGGLLEYCTSIELPLDYRGIDVVAEMVEYARARFGAERFLLGDVFALEEENKYDYVVCNAILTQKLSATIPQMEAYSNCLLKKMFSVARFGIAANFMSTRVNFMVDNLYYRSPIELLTYSLLEISPRVRIDHGYSSLASGVGKFYDYTIYIYKDR
jgi:SAM-dependent methyltransferase